MIRIIAALVLLVQTVLAQNAGGLYFQGNCTGCHNEYSDNAAPSVVAFVAVYRMHYPEKKVFVNQMTKWLLDPAYETSRMKQWVREYGLMPKVVDDAYTLKAIAAYLYEQY